MGSAELITLDSLGREWIVECSGREFLAAVEADLDFLSQTSDGALEEVVVIDEEDPVKFASMFFAAVRLQMPVALANPAWGEQETREFEALLLAEPIARGSILISTGGTTDGMKLAIHNWSSLSASAVGLQSFLGGGSIDSCCLLPLFHVSGLMQLVRSFVTGGRIRFNDAETSAYCLSLVPTQLQRLIQVPDEVEKLRSARVIFVGGAAIPDAVAVRVRELGLPIVPVYGMTETAAMVAAVPKDEYARDPEAGAAAIGQARLSIDPDGRIRIQTPALFRGYQGKRSPNLENGFVVNDEGSLDASGRLRVHGRVDRLINTGGEKVDPREVEAALLEIDSVSEVLVVGEDDEEWGQRVVVYVVCKGNRDESKLSQSLRGRMTAFKIPKRFYFVDALPLDARGKFKRPV